MTCNNEGLSGKGDLDFVIVKIHARLIKICQELVSNSHKGSVYEGEVISPSPPS